MPVTRTSPRLWSTRPSASDPNDVTRPTTSLVEKSVASGSSERSMPKVSARGEEHGHGHRERGDEHRRADGGLRVEADDLQRAVVDVAEGERAERERPGLVGGAVEEAAGVRRPRLSAGAPAAAVLRAGGPGGAACGPRYGGWPAGRPAVARVVARAAASPVGGNESYPDMTRPPCFSFDVPDRDGLPSRPCRRVAPILSGGSGTPPGGARPSDLACAADSDKLFRLLRRVPRRRCAAH